MKTKDSGVPGRITPSDLANVENLQRLAEEVASLRKELSDTRLQLITSYGESEVLHEALIRGRGLVAKYLELVDERFETDEAAAVQEWLEEKP